MRAGRIQVRAIPPTPVPPIAVPSATPRPADPTATQALQSRARQLIVAAGGSIEPPAATAAPPVDG